MIETNSWIPCSEILPENILPYNKKKRQPHIDVLISTKKGIVTKVQRKCFDINESPQLWYWSRIFDDVEAWMPLPKSYRK